MPCGHVKEDSLHDLLTIRSGRHGDPVGHVHESTRGWGLDSRGLFRLLERKQPGLRKVPVAGWMLHSLRVRYDQAEWESTTERHGTEFRQVTVDLAI